MLARGCRGGGGARVGSDAAVVGSRKRWMDGEERGVDGVVGKVVKRRMRRSEKDAGGRTRR